LNIVNIFTGIAFTLVLSCQSPTPPKLIPAMIDDIDVLEYRGYSNSSTQAAMFPAPFYLDYDKQGNCVVRSQHKDDLKFAWDVRVVLCDVEFKNKHVLKNTTSF